MGLQGVTKEVVSSLLDARRRLRRVALINFIKKYFACIYLIIFIVKQNNKFKKKKPQFFKKDYENNEIGYSIKHLFHRNAMRWIKFPTSVALYCEI